MVHLKKLVLIGAGHAHLKVIYNIAAIQQHGGLVTVIHPSRWLYYPGMLPGYVGNSYNKESMRFDIERILQQQGATYIKEYARAINPQERTISLASGKVIAYDLLSCNVGSVTRTDCLQKIEATSIGKTIFLAKPAEQFLSFKTRLIKLLATCPANRKICCVVVGGGPGAHEFAANIWYLAHKMGYASKINILILRGTAALAAQGRQFSKMVRRTLQAKNINCIDEYATEIEADGVRCNNGLCHRADIICISTGVITPPLFTNSALPTDKNGALRVNRYLQSIADARILGGGDCIAFDPRSLDRVGVYAVRQMEILTHNIWQLLLRSHAPQLRAFRPQRNYFFALNVGEERGVATKWRINFAGRLAFKLKDRFDMTFMDKYQ